MLIRYKENRSLDIEMDYSIVELKFAAQLNRIKSINAKDLSDEVVYEKTNTGKLPVIIYGITDNDKKVVIKKKKVSYLISE